MREIMTYIIIMRYILQEAITILNVSEPNNRIPTYMRPNQEIDKSTIIEKTSVLPKNTVN